MSRYFAIWFIGLFFIADVSATDYPGRNISFNFYGDSVTLQTKAWQFVDFSQELTENNVAAFYNRMLATDYNLLLSPLFVYRAEHNCNDWVYYQLIRKTAEAISPKAENYERYTLYKWFLLMQSGYDTRLLLFNKHKILFYVFCDENIYDIPQFNLNGRQFVCLNYHDYGEINFEEEVKNGEIVSMKRGERPFSYKVTRLPDFTPQNRQEKELSFNYNNKNYHFKIELNPEVDTIFKNYPVVDFESYFNIPLSSSAYQSLIPMLKKATEKMTEEKGIDYLMEFTRNAFLYEDDKANFGKEKRMGAEQTLFNKYSDCDDRAALFFCLVKEIYNKPMIVLLYPTHVTIAVNFTNPVGKAIMHNNMAFSVCEPTPQNETLRIGELSAKYKKQEYKIAYEYTP